MLFQLLWEWERAAQARIKLADYKGQNILLYQRELVCPGWWIQRGERFRRESHSKHLSPHSKHAMAAPTISRPFAYLALTWEDRVCICWNIYCPLLKRCRSFGFGATAKLADIWSRFHMWNRRLARSKVKCAIYGTCLNNVDHNIFIVSNCKLFFFPLLLVVLLPYVISCQRLGDLGSCTCPPVPLERCTHPEVWRVMFLLPCSQKATMRS